VGQLKSVHTFHSTLFTTIDIGSYSGPAEISPHISQYLIHNYRHWILQWASWNQSIHFNIVSSTTSSLNYCRPVRYFDTYSRNIGKKIYS